MYQKENVEAATALGRPPLAPRQRTWVEFVDARGTGWRVSERFSADDAGAAGPTCLVFDCGEVMRRVWTYPAHWRELTPDALLALSWER